MLKKIYICSCLRGLKLGNIEIDDSEGNKGKWEGAKQGVRAQLKSGIQLIQKTKGD